MTQHTPGPWQDIYQDDHWTMYGPNHQRVFSIKAGVIPKNPNARLIAAAPEMLALLTEWPVNMPAEKWNDWHAKRRALLARIEGKG